MKKIRDKNSTLFSTVVLVALFILIMVALFLGQNRNMNQVAKQAAFDNMKNNLNAKSKAVEQYVENCEGILRYYSSLPCMKAYLKNPDDKEACEDVMNSTQEMIDSLKNWEGIYLADETTTVRAHSCKEFAGIQILQKDYATLLLNILEEERDVVNVGIIPSPLTGENLMSLFCPIFDDDGSLLGYTGGGPYATDLKYLIDGMKKQGIESSRFAIISNDSQQFIMSEDLKQLGNKVDDEIINRVLEIAKQDMSGEVVEFEVKDSNKQVFLVAYSYSSKYNWISILVDKRENAYGAIDKTRSLMIQTQIIAMIIFTITAAIMIRRLGYVQNQKRRADRENIAKSAFLANMSHEIRTPMNAVVGMAEILMNTNLNDEQKNYVESIKESGTALVYMINDILDYSKIESGNMTLIPKEYQVSSLVRNVSMIIQNRIGDKDIRLITQVDDSVPNVLIGDDIRIRQILINLLNNAVKFTDAGNIQLLVSSEKTTDKDTTLVVKVKDSGMGIAKEDLDKIFESFKQVDTTKNREKEGTGLGLAICRQLCALMDGHIEVESEVGVGTTFTCCVKQQVASDEAAKELEGRSEVEQEKAFILPNAKILIVDDNKVNLMVAKGLMKPYQMKIDTALSGEEAIELVKKKKYDMIFMDHMMPKMDGIEAICIIRKLDVFDGYYKKAKVVALTANAMSEAQEAFFEAGVNGFLAKPVETKQIREVLLREMDQKLIEEIE